MKYINCQFCGADNSKYLYPAAADPDSVYGCNYVWCGRCRVAYLNPMPEADELARFYEIVKEQPGAANPAEFKLSASRRRAIERLRLSRGRDRLLDIGCGMGEIVWCLMEEGWDVMGVDPYFDGSGADPRLAGRIVRKPLDETGFDEGGFSLVMLWSVLEHVAAPAPLMKEIARLQPPGGRLIVSVPNLNTFQHRLLKERWPGFGPPGHLFVYTERGLARALTRFGYEPEHRMKDPHYDRWMLKNGLRNLFAARARTAAAGRLPPGAGALIKYSSAVFAFLFVHSELLIGKSSTSLTTFIKTARPASR